jgi:hypothetical protein
MKAEPFDITKPLISNKTGNRQMPLPIIYLKQAFAAQSVLPAALMCSVSNAVFLNKNKNVDTKNKQNVSDGKNCFLLIETMCTPTFFFLCRQIKFGAASSKVVA